MDAGFLWLRSGGGLSDELQERATDVALALLRHLHVWGAAHASPEPAPAAAQPDPASTAQAVLQLLTRLTMRHRIALKVRPIAQNTHASMGGTCAAAHQAAALVLRKPAMRYASVGINRTMVHAKRMPQVRPGVVGRAAPLIS